MDGAALLAALRARFAVAADPVRAAKQAAYMKSTMPYYGLSNDAVRALAREVFDALAFGPDTAPAPPGSDPAAAWREAVLTLWRGATHREERYAAIALAGDRRASALAGLPPAGRKKAGAAADVERARATLGMLEEMIVTGAWWDLVDELATHHVVALVEAHRTWMDPVLRAWARGVASVAAGPGGTGTDAEHLWLRRAAILGQLGLKERTDLALLRACIEPSLVGRDDPDRAIGASFWLRKAIGWALRTQARTHPDWVRALVAELGPRLSPLSRKEALKHLG